MYPDPRCKRVGSLFWTLHENISDTIYYIEKESLEEKGCLFPLHSSVERFGSRMLRELHEWCHFEQALALRLATRDFTSPGGKRHM
ncbi:hypothetical protein AVEN_34451-1 [Araneus ventricosus]|uniref:Uncharacterized protein n=1 Tax=Araneus ventricosus TaxID=182803 RepID=A0A4Y2IIK9_ARAVE|nr:hypothetical protein AVEN_34451-1 [Araneus ventricosus]